MNQTRYLQGVLDRFNMANCKSVCTPCDKLIIDPNADKISLTEYKCAIGSLILLNYNDNQCHMQLLL